MQQHMRTSGFFTKCGMAFMYADSPHITDDRTQVTCKTCIRVMAS